MISEKTEREKLCFEKKKWGEERALENNKLRLQKQSMWISTAAIVVPLLVVAATIYGNTRAQKSEAQADFELKAAEVVLDAESVRESRNRADGLVALFPERLPADFSNRLKPLQEKLRGMDKNSLLNLLVAAPAEKRKEILNLWLAFYPSDREQLPENLDVLIE
jgi:hypothetical protein